MRKTGWLIAAVLVVLAAGTGYRAMRRQTGWERWIGAAGDARQATLTREHWYNRQEVLDLSRGQIVPLADATARHAPWVALANVDLSRRQGLLSNWFGRPEAFPQLTAGLVDLCFVPTDDQGHPEADLRDGEPGADWPEGPWRKTLFYQWKIDADHIHLPMLWRGMDGTIGVLRITARDFHEATIETRVIARPDADAAAVRNATGVTFPDGSYFEVLAISTDVTDPNAWFAPGIGPLPMPPIPHTAQMEQYRSWSDGDYTAVGLVLFQASGSNRHGQTSTWGLDNVSIHGAGSFSIEGEFGNRLQFARIEIMKIAGRPDHFGYHMGLASDPWTTALRTEKEPAQAEVDGRIVEFETPVETDEGFGVPVTFSLSWREVCWRIVAQEHEPAQQPPIQSSHGRPTTHYLHGDRIEDVDRDGQRMRKAVFRPMGPPEEIPYLGDVKEFRFDWRPYDRIRVRNVPLRPDMECEVVVEKGWETSAEGALQAPDGTSEEATDE